MVLSVGLQKALDKRAGKKRRDRENTDKRKAYQTEYRAKNRDKILENDRRRRKEFAMNGGPVKSTLDIYEGCTDEQIIMLQQGLRKSDKYWGAG